MPSDLKNIELIKNPHPNPRRQLYESRKCIQMLKGACMNFKKIEHKIRLQKENKTLKQNVLTKRRIHNQRFHHNTLKEFE